MSLDTWKKTVDLQLSALSLGRIYRCLKVPHYLFKQVSAIQNIQSPVIFQFCVPEMNMFTSELKHTTLGRSWVKHNRTLSTEEVNM